MSVRAPGEEGGIDRAHGAGFIPKTLSLCKFARPRGGQGFQTFNPLLQILVFHRSADGRVGKCGQVSILVPMAVRSLRREAGLHVRRCLRCGYAGVELQVSAEDRPGEIPPLVCPNCCEDLYARPPRSYAELEGICDFELVRDEVRLSAKKWARRAYRTEWAILAVLVFSVAALMIWQFADMQGMTW